MMKKNQKQYWDRVAKNKKFTTYLDISLLSKYLDKESLIVDYGCGYGRTLNELFLNDYKNTIGLSMDSFAVAISNGLIIKNLNK